MKRISLLVLYFLLLISVNAQKSADGNTISGSVKDSIQKTSLEYATITLSEKGSKKPLNGTVTDKDGAYMLDKIPDGTYELIFEFIGYKSLTLHDIVVSKNQKLIISVA